MKVLELEKMIREEKLKIAMILDCAEPSLIFSVSLDPGDDFYLLITNSSFAQSNVLCMSVCLSVTDLELLFAL